MAQPQSSQPPPSQPPPSPQALFTIRTAFERFAATVTPEERNDFARTELKHVRDAAIQIEKELAARRSLCNMRRLQPFFQGLDHYSKSVDALCNGTPFLPWIWAPIKLMLQISADFISAFEKLIEAYEKIADALPRFDRLGAALKHDHNFQAVLALVYADILEFHRRAYKFVRQKSWKLSFKSMWAHFDSRFNSILASLAHHSELVDKEAVAVNISEAVERRRLDAQRWDKQEAEWRATKLRAVMCWLGPNRTPPEDELDKISRDCLPGSCDWVINHPNIKPWLVDDKSNALVWLHGKPGAGKSVICSSIVQAIESRNMNVLFYFCTYLGAINDGSLLLLRSLAAQAIQRDPNLAIYVHDNIISSHPISSRRALMGLLPKLLQNLGSVRLVIDGIDEWNPREQKLILDDVLQFLSSTSSSCICKILISSRDVPTISRNLRKKTKGTASISLSHEGDSIHHAIERLIEKRFSENQDSLGELDPGGAILPEIRRILVEKSNGMFLWVRLVLDSLEFAYSPRDLREAIAHLPSDLSELYKRILGRICNPCETQKYQKATRILKWICHSRRPLNKFELVYALALTPDKLVLDDDEVPITEILELCKPLIEERYDGSVAFVHFSVQEYLDSDACNLFLQADAHRDLSFACATLLMSGLQLLEPHVTTRDRLIRVGSGLFRLLPYALEYWTEHFLLYASNGGDINQNHKLIRHLSTMRSQHDQLLSRIKDLRVSSNDTAPHEMLDERLQLVSQLHTHDLIRDVLRLRDLLRQGCEDGKDVEDYSLRYDRTLFSRLTVEFEKSVLCLLSQESVDGLPKDKLESFKSSYASTAFQCRYPFCPNRTAGFASAQLRGQHEATHVRRIYCQVSTCQWSRIGFKNKSGLDNHVRTDHSEVTKILVPSKVRSERHGLDNRQQSQLNGMGYDHLRYPAPHLTNPWASASGISQQQLYPTSIAGHQGFGLQNNPTVSSVNTPTLGTQSMQQQQNRNFPDSSAPGTPAELDMDFPNFGRLSMPLGSQTMQGGDSDWGIGFGNGIARYDGTIDQPAKGLFSKQGGLNQQHLQAAIKNYQLGNDSSELAKRFLEQQILAAPNASTGLETQDNQMLRAGGMNAVNMPGNQFNEFAQQAQNVRQKSTEVYAQNLAQQQRIALRNHAMAKGMNNVQGSPMDQQGLDDHQEMFTGNPPPGPMGNHALQDYKMQLMILDQQKKKRLLMAQQEQGDTSGPHAQGAVGGPAGFPPSMSPQGSRSGPSPNHTNQIKRGTLKMNQQGLRALFTARRG